MKTHLTCCAATLCAALLSSCGSDDATQQQVTDPQLKPTIRLSLASVGEASAISRATEPKLEYGRQIENDIVDAVVIIYDSPLASGSGNVVATAYLNSLGEPVKYNQTEQRLQCTYYDNSGNSQNVPNGNYRVAHRYEKTDIDLDALESNRTYYAIAIANVGNMASTFSGMSVSALRDYVYSGPLYTWNYEGVNANASNLNIGKFAMTAVNEVKFSTVPVDNVIDVGTLMVQRLASRVDIAFGKLLDTDNHSLNDTDETGNFMFDVETRNDGTYRFPVYSENVYTESGADHRMADVYFYLTKIELLNTVTSGTYLVEHSNSTPRYLGNEGSWASGYPANFVESASSRTRENKELTYGTNPYHVIHGNILAWQGSGIFGTYSILGYIGENTFNSYSDDNAYTAIRLSGRLEGLSVDHFSGNEGTHDNQVSVTYRLRHSFGAVNTSNPMVYGVVRNTVYRSYVKFYASGAGVYARFYYYGAGSNGSFSEDDNTNQQVDYTQIPFYEAILEYGSGTTLND